MTLFILFIVGQFCGTEPIRGLGIGRGDFAGHCQSGRVMAAAGRSCETERIFIWGSAIPDMPTFEDLLLSLGHVAFK